MAPVETSPRVTHPDQSSLTNREFLQVAGTALGAFYLGPLIRQPDSLPTSQAKKPPESHLLSDLLLGHYLESGNINDLKQFIPEAGHRTKDELSLFLSSDIPFEVWAGADTSDGTDPSSIMIDAFTKASAISSVLQARGHPLTFFEKLLEKAEESGALKKLSNNNMFGITNYDDAWYVSDETRRDQKAANRITQGHITVDRLLFDDLGNLIIIARKRMDPLVVQKKVNKFWFLEQEILDSNDQVSDQDVDESTLPEITFAVKVKIKDLPAKVWGGKYSDSQPLFDCQAVLTANFFERMRRTRNLNDKREIVAWPRLKIDEYWDNSRSVNISNKLDMAVQEDPNADWYIIGHLAEAVTSDPAIFDFSDRERDDYADRLRAHGLNIRIPVGAKLFLHGLQRRTNGEFIALVEAKDESYASKNLPDFLRSLVVKFQHAYRNRFFWVSYQDLQSPAVRVKQK